MSTENLSLLRQMLLDCPVEELGRHVTEVSGCVQGDITHSAGMVLLYSFAYNTRDDAVIARALHLPLDTVFSITANAIKNKIWEQQLDLDDGTTFLLMMNAAAGTMEYLPENKTWGLTAEGMQYVEEEILNTPEGAEMMRKIGKLWQH